MVDPPVLGSPVAVARNRKAWQDFKKAHPNFEKSKSFKADLGPNIDNYLKTVSALEKLNQRAQSEFRQIEAALAAYEVIVRQASDPAMKRDFDKVKAAWLPGSRAPAPGP